MNQFGTSGLYCLIITRYQGKELSFNPFFKRMHQKEKEHIFRHPPFPVNGKFSNRYTSP